MKKKSLLFLLLTMFMSMVGETTSAHNIAMVNDDGVTIYYKWINNRTELAVTYAGTDWDDVDEYYGNVTIPESVTYNGETYSISKIDDQAFESCEDLTSITIPNSIMSIGRSAFDSCI